MKQHATRLQKFASTRTDEWDKSSKTAVTYYTSNIPVTDGTSDFESTQLVEEPEEIDYLVKQQQELLELQSNVQKSLQMIQNKLKQSKVNHKRKQKSEYTQKASVFQNLSRANSTMLTEMKSKTPDKQEDCSFSKLNKCKSGARLSECKNMSKNHQSFIGLNPAYVDYSEVINDCESNFTRVVITPNKQDQYSTQNFRNDKS